MQDYKYLLERQIGEEIVEEVKKPKNWKKKLYIISSLLVILLVSIFGYFLKERNIKMLKINDFELIGVENSSKEKILELLKKNKNQPLNKIYEKIIKLKWVDDVILRRKLPGTLVVKIIEKRPESLLQLDGSLYLIDKNGEIIDKYQSKFYRRDFIIFQIKGSNDYTKNYQREISYILNILKKYTFSEDISDITINGKNLSIILTEPRIKILISLDKLKDEIYKIEILKRLANNEDVKNAAVAKLDYKNRIYLSRSE